MTIGFKTGPRNWEEGKLIVEEEGARMCEVWYRVDRPDDYGEILAWLKDKGVSVGFHHWGLVDDEIKTNLMSNNNKVRRVTLDQIRTVIEKGAEIGCVYVNIHPGSRWLEKIDFEKEEQSRLEGTETEEDEARELLLEGMSRLHYEAEKSGVLLTVETLPGRENNKLGAREGVYDAGNPSLEIMKSVVEAGFWLANDITHTAGQIALLPSPPSLREDSPSGKGRKYMFDEVMKFTKALEGQTRLVHVNTVREPFDGTDSHDGILEEDFVQDGFPDRDQLVELLRVFERRDDVFMVPEPTEKMRENYLALREMVAPSPSPSVGRDSPSGRGRKS